MVDARESLADPERSRAICAPRCGRYVQEAADLAVAVARKYQRSSCDRPQQVGVWLRHFGLHMTEVKPAAIEDACSFLLENALIGVHLLVNPERPPSLSVSIYPSEMVMMRGDLFCTVDQAYSS